MTTKIVFQNGEEYVLPDGEYVNQTGQGLPGEPEGQKDPRVGKLTIEDNPRLSFAATRAGAFTLGVATKGKRFTIDEMLKIDPNLQTEVKEVTYLGKERLG